MLDTRYAVIHRKAERLYFNPIAVIYKVNHLEQHNLRCSFEVTLFERQLKIMRIFDSLRESIRVKRFGM